MPKKICGAKFRSEEFRNFVYLNGEGGFVPKENRPIDGKVWPGCFTMYVNDEALKLLESHERCMLADGTLY